MSYDKVKGYVYIVSNRAYRNAIKVGKARNINSRLKQLSGATGVLYPFKLEACFRSLDYTADERKAHLALHDFRIRTNKEFYRMPTELAVHELTKLFGPPKYSRASHQAKLQAQQEQDAQNEALRLERVQQIRQQRVPQTKPPKRIWWPWVVGLGLLVAVGAVWILI
jgi:predicted GIY-YIG superfamily endonuclease